MENNYLDKLQSIFGFVPRKYHFWVFFVHWQYFTFTEVPQNQNNNTSQSLQHEYACIYLQNGQKYTTKSQIFTKSGHFSPLPPANLYENWTFKPRIEANQQS